MRRVIRMNTVMDTQLVLTFIDGSYELTHDDGVICSTTDEAFAKRIYDLKLAMLRRKEDELWIS